MTNLTSEQLTGRVSTHVCEIPQLACVLHPQAASAFLALAQAAAHAGIDLAPVSSFRSFSRQLDIWNGKFRGQRPLLDRDSRALDVTALPGASRHHWGSEVDVFDRAALMPGTEPRLTPHEYAAGGVFARLSGWMAARSAAYGFFRPYDSDRGGVHPEPWHLSFAPVASAALPAVTLELLAEALRDAELAGAAVVRRLLPDIHERYVCRVAAPSSEALRGAAGPAAS